MKAINPPKKLIVLFIAVTKIPEMNTTKRVLRRLVLPPRIFTERCKGIADITKIKRSNQNAIYLLL